LSSGPNKGNTSQQTKTGGNSISQSYPVPEKKRVMALRLSAITIKATIIIAVAYASLSNAVFSKRNSHIFGPFEGIDWI
jgi:hypothetical protein